MLSIYKASAGSGKTFTLTREYLRMLLRDAQPTNDNRLPHSRILAVTFTKKATAEMKERILRELYLLSTNPEASPHKQALLDDPKIRLNIQQLQQRAKDLLIGILQDYTRFSVSTIDGFFQQVIRTFAMEMELSATYDLSLDGEEIVQQAVDDIFKRIREDRTEDQELINWIIEFAHKNIENDTKWNPSESIKLFSNQLLKEQLMRRMNEIQKVFSDKSFMRTYSSQLQQVCQSAEKKVNLLLQQGSSIFATERGWNRHIISAFGKTPEDWLKQKMGATFHNIIANPELIFTKSATNTNEQQHLLDIYHLQLKPIFYQLDDICSGDTAKDYITANAILPNLYTMAILQDVARQIEETNRNIGRLPISETNQLVNQIIDGQDAPFIYERFGQYFRHYMIDEFQDTSSLQWENFAPLIHENESNNRDNLIVGDIKQSIYRFRNSDWHLLRDIHKQFDNAHVHSMETNWRTAPIIVKENEKLILRYSQWIVEQISNDTQDISSIYSEEAIHQDPHKKDKGYFHMQFFDSEDSQETTLETLDQQLKNLVAEGIDLKRVTLLVRYTREAALLAQFLVERGYNVQSSEGLKLGTHPTIQLLISLLQQENNTINPITEAYIKQIFGEQTEEQTACIVQAQQLPLYEQVQLLIDGLDLAKAEGVTPYLTAFQDIIYQFTKKRVSDRKAFLEYWERKGDKTTIAAPQTTDALRILTIHSSKGLEFDIVFIPFFTWDICKIHNNDILWCTPTTQPFNALPLVAVHPSNSLLHSHFKNEYQQEQLAQYIDNLNLTYVALTRAKYRLYIYGQIQKQKTNNIGHRIFSLYKDELDSQLIYRTSEVAAPLPPIEENTTTTYAAQYISTPIGERLTLRSRAEDDFAQDSPLEIIDLGILMHLWLSYIHTWEDAEPSLTRLMQQGQVTELQAVEMRQQFKQLKTLIQRELHDEWFSHKYQILAEQDILIPTGNIQRPDRIMILDKHAIVIDYKFGKEQPISHMQQVRDYMLLLNQMGYTTEGYVLYNALQTINTIK